MKTSIEDPSAFVVPGFDDGIMPKTYKEQLSPEQIDTLVKYLLGVAGGGKQVTLAAKAARAGLVPGGDRPAARVRLRDRPRRACVRALYGYDPVAGLDARSPPSR